MTDRTTKILIGIIVFLSLGSPQAGLALQEEISVYTILSLDVVRVQAEAGELGESRMMSECDKKPSSLPATHICLDKRNSI